MAFYWTNKWREESRHPGSTLSSTFSRGGRQKEELIQFVLASSPPFGGVAQNLDLAAPFFLRAFSGALRGGSCRDESAVEAVLEARLRDDSSRFGESIAEAAALTFCFLRRGILRALTAAGGLKPGSPWSAADSVARNTFICEEDSWLLLSHINQREREREKEIMSDPAWGVDGGAVPADVGDVLDVGREPDLHLVLLLAVCIKPIVRSRWRSSSARERERDYLFIQGRKYRRCGVAPSTDPSSSPTSRSRGWSSGKGSASAASKSRRNAERTPRHDAAPPGKSRIPGDQVWAALGYEPRGESSRRRRRAFRCGRLGEPTHPH